MRVKNEHLGNNLVKWYFTKDIEIPRGWNYGKFEELCEYKKGKVPKEFFDEKKDNTLVYLSASFLEKGIKKFVKKERMVQIEKSDIVMIGDGEGSGRAYVDNEGALSSTFLRIKSKKKKLLNNFLFYYLSNHYPTFKNTKYGSAIPHLDKFILDKLPISFPIVSEQEKIISILSNIEYVIQYTDKQIEQTQRLKKGLMQKLLTKGIGHTKFKKITWLYGKEFNIPEEWNVEKLKNICTKVTDGTHSTPNYCESGNLFLSVQNVRPNQIILDNIKHISKEEHTSLIKRTKPEKLDILYTKIGVTYGFAAVIEDISDFSIFVSLALIKPKRKIIDPYFLSNFLNSYLGKSQADMRIKGIAVPDLHLNEIQSFKIFLPSMTEQKQIASILSNIDSKIRKQKLYKTNLELLKKRLMQILLTGQIRVKI